jgi:NAD(P)-dependent dehydrogenase (short-subunit alcohol dehydrogenase family)
MLSIGMAYDYGGDGIRVNCICPGLTRTEMGGGELEGSGFAERILASLPLHRFADPSEIANGILFLASDESSFCCGTVLAVDGGEIIS